MAKTLQGYRHRDSDNSDTVARGCTSTGCQLQVALKQLQQAAALFKEALLDSPDDWTSLQQYLDCMLPQTLEADWDASDAQPSGDERESRNTGDHSQLEHGILQLQVLDKQQVAAADFGTGMRYVLGFHLQLVFDHRELGNTGTQAYLWAMQDLLIKPRQCHSVRHTFYWRADNLHRCMVSHADAHLCTSTMAGESDLECRLSLAGLMAESFASSHNLFNSSSRQAYIGSEVGIHMGCCRRPFRKLKRPYSSCLLRLTQTPS